MVGKELDILTDGVTEDGEVFGRIPWDAPDIDNIVFLQEPEEGLGLKPLGIGQMRRCKISGRYF